MFDRLSKLEFPIDCDISWKAITQSAYRAYFMNNITASLNWEDLPERLQTAWGSCYTTSRSYA